MNSAGSRNAKMTRKELRQRCGARKVMMENGSYFTMTFSLRTKDKGGGAKHDSGAVLSYCA